MLTALVLLFVYLCDFSKQEILFFVGIPVIQFYNLLFYYFSTPFTNFITTLLTRKALSSGASFL